MSRLEVVMPFPGTGDAPPWYTLRLYVTGNTPRSLRAVANTREFCEDNLRGRYALEVIDIYQEPARARDAQVVAAPTLVRESPLPLRRMVGDMAERERLRAALGLQAPGAGPALQ
jgi:circadian clock protein KaiB